MSNLETNSKYVFTGGPGFGKSSVLEALIQEGFTCLPEAPRQLILEQRVFENGVLPQSDFAGFAHLVIKRMCEQYQSAGPGIILLDRGLPDLLAYLQHDGQEINRQILETVNNHPYESPVFFFPDWEELYDLDGVRYESYEQARDIGCLIRESYESLGYRVVEVPRNSVLQRVKFVRRILVG